MKLRRGGAGESGDMLLMLGMMTVTTVLMLVSALVRTIITKK